MAFAIYVFTQNIQHSIWSKDTNCDVYVGRPERNETLGLSSLLKLKLISLDAWDYYAKIR